MSIKNLILIFLFELGFNIKFNIVGVISISELFLFITVPFIIAKINWKVAKELKYITIAYLVLLGVQIFSEIIVQNDLSSSLKGLAVTVVSYLHFLFLLYYLTKDKRIILAIFISQIAGKLFFRSSTFDEISMQDTLAGEEAVYLKFYLSFVLIYIFLVWAIVFKNKYNAIAFSLLGIVFIVLGARSNGMIVFLAGLITYLMEHRTLVLNRRLLIGGILVVAIISYASYAFYVNQVLAGEITSGNSRQLLLCKNPYNPLELLMAGRSEMWVGWQAFMDKFWFGHGSWAYDTTGKYRMMMYEMQGENMPITVYANSRFLIPSHSVLIGYAMANGVSALFTLVIITFRFLRMGIMSFRKCDSRYLIVLSYLVIDLFWNILFSPTSHLRLSIPINFAVIFILYLSRKNIVKKQMVLC